jgi:Xaa-Pro aminopeptidase
MCNIYQDRLRRLTDGLAKNDTDWLIVAPGASMRYLCGYSAEGYERLICLCISGTGEAAIIVPAINGLEAKENPAGIDRVITWDDTGGWSGAIDGLGILASRRIAVDETLQARFLLPMQQWATEASFVAGSEIINYLRSIKSPDELALMNAAAAATDVAIKAAFDACVVGASEIEIADAIKAAILSTGSIESFATIVASGPNSANPHHEPSSRRIQEGDVIVLDFGACLNGYHGDITRTVAVGHASDEVHAVYKTVLSAHLAAANAAGYGMPAEAVDIVCRDVIERAGYGEWFTHRTGHGIGMEDHEHPNIVAGNTAVLVPGNCFSIEPGIYLPGRFGIRLENIFAIEMNGDAKSLNAQLPTDIPVVGI